MTANMYTQEDLEETHQSTESNDSPALTVKTSSEALETATVDDQTNDYPASTAVFATNELLSLILSKVPNSANLIRVSKIWNSVVYNDIGYSIQPSNVCANHPMSIPEYAKTFSGRIHVNPLLICHPEKNGENGAKRRYGQ